MKGACGEECSPSPPDAAGLDLAAAGGDVSLSAMKLAGVATGRIRFNFELDQPRWHACAHRNFTDRQLLGIPVT
ncbi:MAG: hypothetical protein F4213_03505 [Boseongicola sp. SB0677_bin_26]|nr:hypothetical protein [Boseongicola sp. SB0677_bin_26]